MSFNKLHYFSSISALFAGALFGLGLSWSEMINPEKVLGFLDIAGDWDASLLFVMIGALTITIPGFQLLKLMDKPFLAMDFSLPTRKDLDSKLISGAVIFGIGWGLVGLCPGPAISGLASMKPELILFVLAMFAGFFTHKFMLEKP